MTVLHDRVLIVEDDAGICRFLKAALEAAGYDVMISSRGSEALALIASHCPDCILLDLGLPDMDGTKVITGVREWSRVPIIVISARSGDSDKVDALDRGADDYLTKPFSTQELLARMRAALRHTRTTAENDGIALNGLFTAGELTVDYRRHRAFIAGRDVGLTPNEFRIVALLGRHAGTVMTYRQIMREIWGPFASSDNKILRVHMTNIRRKLEPNPDEPGYILTEVGVGYRMRD